MDHSDLYRTDCIECGDQIYHPMLKGGHGLFWSGFKDGMQIWRNTDTDHYILVIDKYVIASCLFWHELDQSRGKLWNLVNKIPF